MRITDVRKSKISDLVKNFEKLSNPFPHIICRTAVGWLCVALLLRWDVLQIIGVRYPLNDIGLQRFTFLMYATLYACWWFVYLSSRQGAYGVRSLRSLLDVTSGQFARSSSRLFDDDELADAIDDKSRTTIGSLSILVSASFASLALMLQIYVTYQYPKITPQPGRWANSMMALAGGLGFLAFACLLIAADAHDTVLNRFPRRDETNAPFALKLKRWAYLQAVNRRYIGFSLLIAQVACGAAAFSPIYGTLCIAAALTVGYTYWFPSVARSDLVSAWGGMVGWVLFGPLIVFGIIAYAPTRDLKGISFVLSACALWALTMPMLNTAIKRVAEAARGNTQTRRYMVAWCCAVAHVLGAVMAATIAVAGKGTWSHFWSVVWHVPTAFAGAASYVGTVGFCMMTTLFANRPEAAMQLTRLKLPCVAMLSVWMLGEWDMFRESQALATIVALGTALWAIVMSRRPSYVGRVEFAALVLGVIFVWSAQEVTTGAMIRGHGFLGEAISPSWRSFGCIGSPADGTHSFLCCGSAVVVAAVLGWAAVTGLLAVFLAYCWQRLRRNGDPPISLRRDHNEAPRVGLFCLYGVIGIGLATPLYLEGVHQLGLVRANLMTSGTMVLGLAFFARLQAIRDEDPRERIERRSWAEAALFFLVALLAAL